MTIRPGGAGQAKFDPTWQDGAFIGIRDRSDEMLIVTPGIRDRSDEMLIVTPSGVYKMRNDWRRPELERCDVEFFTTLKGTPWNPNPAEGDMAVPMPAPAPVSLVVVAAAPVDRAASRLYIRRSDVQKFDYSMNELSGMQISDDGHDCSRAH